MYLAAQVHTGASVRLDPVFSGMPQALTWFVDGIAGGNATVGTIAGSGMYTAPAVAPTPAQVTVSARNAKGQTLATLALTVVAPPPPSGTFAATLATIQVGQSASLAWQATGATAASIDNGIGVVVPAGGSVTVSPSATTTYDLTLTGPGGTAVLTATVTVVATAPLVAIDPVTNNVLVKGVPFIPCEWTGGDPSSMGGVGYTAQEQADFWTAYRAAGFNTFTSNWFADPGGGTYIHGTVFQDKAGVFGIAGKVNWRCDPSGWTANEKGIIDNVLGEMGSNPRFILSYHDGELDSYYTTITANIAAHNAGDTVTISVNGLDAFLPIGQNRYPFVVRVDNEEFMITSASGSSGSGTISGTSGVYGTTPLAHTSGAVISNVEPAYEHAAAYVQTRAQVLGKNVPLFSTTLAVHGGNPGPGAGNDFSITLKGNPPNNPQTFNQAPFAEEVVSYGDTWIGLAKLLMLLRAMNGRVLAAYPNGCGFCPGISTTGCKEMLTNIGPNWPSSLAEFRRWLWLQVAFNCRMYGYLWGQTSRAAPYLNDGFGSVPPQVQAVDGGYQGGAIVGWAPQVFKEICVLFGECILAKGIFRQIVDATPAFEDNTNASFGVGFRGIYATQKIALDGPYAGKQYVIAANMNGVSWMPANEPGSAMSVMVDGGNAGLTGTYAFCYSIRTPDGQETAPSQTLVAGFQVTGPVAFANQGCVLGNLVVPGDCQAAVYGLKQGWVVPRFIGLAAVGASTYTINAAQGNANDATWGASPTSTATYLETSVQCQIDTGATITSIAELFGAGTPTLSNGTATNSAIKDTLAPMQIKIWEIG